MAGLTWFELDVDFSEHPKTVALAVALKNPLAEAYVSRIWAYCYKNARDRFSGPAATATIEQAARWTGKPGHLVAALLQVGYLERTHDNSVTIAHGVGERLGPHLAARAAAAERQRRRREKAARDLERHAGVTRDDPVTSPVSHTPTRQRPDRDLTREAEADSGGCLETIRAKLAPALGLQAVTIGKNPERTLASFRRWLDAGVEEDELVAECVRLAREKGVTPSSLAWWPGWLDTVSDAVLNRSAARGRTGGA